MDAGQNLGWRTSSPDKISFAAFGNSRGKNAKAAEVTGRSRVGD